MNFMQIAIVEVPEEYVGPVVELLGRRRGHMTDMQGTGYLPLFSSLVFLMKYLLICRLRFIYHLISI